MREQPSGRQATPPVREQPSGVLEGLVRHVQLVDHVQDAGENPQLLGECSPLVLVALSAALLAAGQLKAKVVLALPATRSGTG